jgi:DNA-binding CsgD family transcriptional regulator
MSLPAVAPKRRIRVHIAPSAGVDERTLPDDFEFVAHAGLADVAIDGRGVRPSRRHVLGITGRRASGELPDDASPDQIAAAVRAVAAGLFVRAADAFGLAPLVDPPVADLLSHRELEVLQAMASGAGNKEIARQLGLSLHTVKYYLEAIFRKLDVRSRAEAVARGLSRLNEERLDL